MALGLTTTLLNVVDPAIAENFRLLEARLADMMQFDGFRPLEMSVKNAVTDYKIYHNLGYIPEDIIVTRNTTDVTVVFQYDKFTTAYMVANISGACSLRMLLGKFKGSIKA